MEMSLAKYTILKALFGQTLLTEHEIATAMSGPLRRRSSEIQPDVGRLLVELRDAGFVWAGQMFNHADQHMWSACLTAAGRKAIGHAA